MVEKLKIADIVIGDRRVAYGGVDRFRGALSSIFTGVVNLLFGLDTDVQSGLKVFRRKIYDEIEVQPGKWSLDLYLISHALHKGYSIANVPIAFSERKAGESKVIPAAVAAELLMTALTLKLMAVMTRLFGGESRTLSKQGAAGHMVTADAPNAELVKHYEQWLDADTKHGYAIHSPEVIEKYKDMALRATEVKGKEVAIFAPFREKFSALRTFTVSQVLVLGFLILALGLGLAFFPMQTMVTAI